MTTYHICAYFYSQNPKLWMEASDCSSVSFGNWMLTQFIGVTEILKIIWNFTLLNSSSALYQKRMSGEPQLDSNDQVSFQCMKQRRICITHWAVCSARYSWIWALGISSPTQEHFKAVLCVHHCCCDLLIFWRISNNIFFC